MNFKNFGHGYSEKVMAFETAMLDEALKKSSGNQSKAADFLGISERHLRSRMQKIGLVNKYKNRSEKWKNLWCLSLKAISISFE